MKSKLYDIANKIEKYISKVIKAKHAQKYLVLYKNI